MDDKFDFKSFSANPLSQEKFSEILKNNPDIFQQTLTPKINIPEIPKVQLKKQEPIIIKDDKPSKKGIEGWYERNQGKITIFSIGSTLFFAIVAIIEAYWLYILSR